MNRYTWDELVAELKKRGIKVQRHVIRKLMNKHIIRPEQFTENGYRWFFDADIDIIEFWYVTKDKNVS